MIGIEVLNKMNKGEDTYVKRVFDYKGESIIAFVASDNIRTFDISTSQSMKMGAVEYAITEKTGRVVKSRSGSVSL